MTDDEAVAALLEEFADRLEATGVEYKPRAYRRAAENVRESPESVVELATGGPDAVADIDGVGEAISAKIVEYVETGTIEELEELRSELPVEMDALTRIEGVGPKTVGALYRGLGIRTLDDLEAAAEAGEIRDLDGFGETTESNILEGIPFAREAHERSLLSEARPRGEAVREYLTGFEAVTECELAGSIRRWSPTVGDVDVLAASEDGEAVVESFTDWPAVETVIEAGSGKASVRAGGVRVDLRVVGPEEFGATLQYFTGSKDHNVTLRNRAIDRGLKMNEYGAFDVPETDGEGQRAGQRVAGETEAGMYDAVGLSWIPPELREDRGEVAAAATGELPDLLSRSDLRGDLHVHTDWSDGAESVESMVAGAAAFGHEYVAITDHATGPGMVGGVGLDDATLREQLPAVRAVAEDADIEVFAGVEANVAADGSVSVADEVLADLDLVVASPHAALDGDGTDRLTAAARHPAVDVLGHPTGRRINERAGLDPDIERIAAVAASHDTALEINAAPGRLDLSGRDVQTALGAGATVVVNTDAHRTRAFEHVRYGLHTARRGWAGPGDVLNTRDAAGVRDFLG